MLFAPSPEKFQKKQGYINKISYKSSFTLTYSFNISRCKKAEIQKKKED